MAWVYLLVAALFEVGWAVGLKSSQGFTKLWPSVWTILAMVVSFVCLAQSVRTLPVGTAYAAWTGLGAAGTVLLGMVLFSEPATLWRIGCLLLILSGVLGLKLAAE